MLVIKIVNQRVVQAAFTNPKAGCQAVNSLLSSEGRNNQFLQFARTLVQSTSQNQKITVANNQSAQLIPIARNISFRQCQIADLIGSHRDVARASFLAHDIEHPSRQEGDVGVASPLDALRKKARSAVERRDSVVKGKYYGQIFNEAIAGVNERRLVVLMSWLQAQEKHIEKYRQFYLERGFDVLNVKTSPYDLLLPGLGATKIAQDFVRFLEEKQYSQVMLHGFSVGGFMFGQLLLELEKCKPETRNQVLQSIRGMVFDSLVPLEGIFAGVATVTTNTKLAADMVKNLLHMYIYLTHSFTNKYYQAASEVVWSGPLNRPSLFLLSKEDHVADHQIVERLIKIWSEKGIDTKTILWDHSPHVMHFKTHHDAYVDEVDKFMQRIDMPKVGQSIDLKQ